MHLSPANIAHLLWCRKRRRSARSLFPITLLVLAAAAFAAAPPGANDPVNLKLDRADEAVVNAPFAPLDSRPLLRTIIASLEARRTDRALLPTTAPEPRIPNQMGWSVSDQVYWQSIPAAAREIPIDWNQFPVVRYTNSQLGGVREVRLATTQNYDQWLLSDPTHKLSACISVEKSTHKVYFMEIARSDNPADKGKWIYHAAFDNCYSCHPSGPRAIRPLEEADVDRSQLAQFNRRILAYHACDYGDAVNVKDRGLPVSNSACKSCHNGVNRGNLYGIHEKTIEFKQVFEKTMPPGKPAG
jgi:hypothetical protein